MKPADAAFLVVAVLSASCILASFLVLAEGGSGRSPNGHPNAKPGPTVIVSPAPSAPSASPARTLGETVIPNLLWIAGLDKLRGADPSPGTNAAPTFHHPVKPEEITVTLQTFDGQRWTAKWERQVSNVQH